MYIEEIIFSRKSNHDKKIGQITVVKNTTPTKVILYENGSEKDKKLFKFSANSSKKVGMSRG